MMDVTQRFEVLINEKEECSLKDFLERDGRPVAIGCSYFHFQGKEDICPRKEIVLMKKVVYIMYQMHVIICLIIFRKQSSYI